MIEFTLKFITLCLVLNEISGFDAGDKMMLEKIEEWQNYMAKEKKINNLCSKQLSEWWNLLVNSDIMEDNWAWRMLDASNKINDGILTGNLVGTGNLDECLAIDVVENGTKIKGQYCYGVIQTKFKPSKSINISVFRTNRQDMIPVPTAYLASICIPHECKLSDLMEEKRMEIDDMCQTADTLKEWDGSDWAFIGFIITIGILVVYSTCYDWYIRNKEQEAIHPITLAFSFYTNSEKLLKISRNPDQMHCLNGLRALSMLWIMGGHRFSVSITAPMVNFEQAVQWKEKIYSQYIQGAPVAVDSFFFLAGVLISYGFLKTQSKPNARFNVFMYYLHRYLRLTPAIAVLYFFHVTFLRHVTTGPLWPIIANLERENCLEHAYSYFLYIQNYVNPELQCLAHTWYLSVDMQIFIISPLILIPMVKWPKYAGYEMIGLIVVSILPPLLISYSYNILEFDLNYMKLYYVQPYTRISPWLVGVLLGYIFYQLRDEKVKIYWLTNLLIWAIVLIGMLAILYVGNEMARTKDVLSFAFYNGFHRLFWAVGLMWIVFACQKGHGGFVNWFLSLPIFQVIARLSYSMYLIHMVIQIITIFRKRTPLFFNDYDMLNQSFGDIITVTFLAFFFCLMFESPMVIIEKIIFSPSKSTQNVNHFATEPEKSHLESVAVYLRSIKGKRICCSK